MEFPYGMGGPALVAVSFAMSVVIMTMMLRVRGRSLLLDHPNHRSLHTQPTPRVGGIAIVIATLAALLILRWEWPVIAGLAGLALLSAMDDHKGLPIFVRFTAHAAAALTVALHFVPQFPAWKLAALACGLIWMINLYNFMDGSDGLAGGMAVTGFAFLGLAAALSQDTNFAVGCFCISAAGLGFLLFNFHPARAFMGDSGSVGLGFLAGAVGLGGWSKGYWNPLFPALVFSPFIADATVTLLRRLLSGKRVWEAHKEHYYQRLIQRGWGHRRTALAAYAAMLLAGGAALSVRAPAMTAATWGIAALTAIAYAAAFYLIDTRDEGTVSSCRKR